MDDVERKAAAVLDELVPRYEDEGDWAAVLADAGIRPHGAPLTRVRRRYAVFVLAVASAAALAAVVLAWPFGGQSASLLDRALAAVGEEPVVHVVFEGELSRTLVDLDTGERRTIHLEREVWFDPERGFHQIERFAGVVQNEYLFEPGEASEEESNLYLGFATGYREALESGTARIVAEEVIDGVPVIWIRVSTHVAWYSPTTGDSASFSIEVAVSRETFEPLYVRRYDEGEPIGRRTGAKVVSLETLPPGAGDFTADGPAREPFSFGGLGMSGPPISFADGARILARPPMWAGPKIANLPLARTSKAKSLQGSAEGGGWNETVTGFGLFYGNLADEPEDRIGRPPNLREPHVMIYEFTRVNDALSVIEVGVYDYLPPTGSVLIVDGRKGFLVKDGIVVLIQASKEDLVIEAARALRAYPS
ncbi:MAG: hypothetical protein M3327_09655 [Actinomycetota bacterium]|nr:hypothetical protein [Actinomycetota bacterium]